MSKLSYTGYSKRLDKEITIVSNGTESQLKKQLYYFFKPDAVLTICEFGNRNIRLDELELKDIFSNPYEIQKVKEFNEPKNMKTNPNEPICPTDKTNHGAGSEIYFGMGLTKREYFAAMAMQGILANLPNDKEMMIKQLEYYLKEYGNIPMAKSIAKESIVMADALINELNHE